MKYRNAITNKAVLAMFIALIGGCFPAHGMKNNAVSKAVKLLDEVVVAIQENNLKSLKDAIDEGAPIRYFNKYNNFNNKGDFSPLHLAVALENPKMVKVLLESGLNPNRKDEIGNTPLLTAADVGDKKSFLLLMQFGARDTEKNYGQTPVRNIHNNSHVYHSKQSIPVTMRSCFSEVFFEVNSKL
jgi:ankyrin repeat protein